MYSRVGCGYCIHFYKNAPARHVTWLIWLIWLIWVEGLLAKQGGNIFRVGVFLDFVRRSGTTRTPHGGASYVRGAKRNRIDPHRGEIERLETRTGGCGGYRWIARAPRTPPGAA